jgi:hypothetical protein
MTVMREIAQIVHAHVDQVSFASAPHNSIVQRTSKELRKNGNDIELHGSDSVSQEDSGTIQIAQTFGKHDIDPLGPHIDVDTKFRGERNENFSVSGLHGQQWNPAGEFNIAHGTRGSRGARLPDFASDQIADVVLACGESRALLDRNLNFRAAQFFGGFHSVHTCKVEDRLATSAGR